MDPIAYNNAALRQHLKEADPTGDHVFLATFREEANAAVSDTDTHITILDSYHQGIKVTLYPDGTWSVVPMGG